MRFKHLSVSLESALTHAMAVKNACQGSARLPLTEDEAAQLGMLAQDLMLTAQWLQHDFAQSFVSARTDEPPPMHVRPPVIQERLDQIDHLIGSSRRLQKWITWAVGAMMLATVLIIVAATFHHVGACAP